MTTDRKAQILELYSKKKASLRYRLHGMAMSDKEWYMPLKALDFAERHHVGIRKDGMTPAFMHQVEMALYAMTLLPHFLFPVRVITAILLHDTPEDTLVTHEEIRDLFGKVVSHDVQLMTKEYKGQKKDLLEYFDDMAGNPVTSLGKGIDRINNQSTMAGVFKLIKQVEYCEETRKYFFKMLKTARRLFPEQELAYENIKFVLTTQISIFEGANAQGIAA